MKRLRSMPDDTKKIQPAEKLSFLRYFAQVFVSKMKHFSFSLLSTKPGIICISSPRLFLRFTSSSPPSAHLSLSLFLPLFFLYQALIACTNAFHEARISRQSRFLTGAPGERSTLSGQRGCRVNILQKIDLSFSISSKR